jgi:hypothetical protein
LKAALAASMLQHYSCQLLLTSPSIAVPVSLVSSSMASAIYISREQANIAHEACCGGMLSP